MLFDFRDGIFVGVHTEAAPSAEEWQRHCVVIERERNATRGVLVFTLGGGPTTQQRHEMRAALHEVPAPPTAILTASTLVRGIITSLNWFLGNQVRAFEPSEVDRALRYLASAGTAIDREKVLETLSQLASKLSVVMPRPRADTRSSRP